MTGILLIILSLLPSFLIALYVYNKDNEKEPIKLLVKLFLLGILSCFMVVAISDLLEIIFPSLISPNNIKELFLHAFIGVALIEEGCKLFMTYIGGYKNKHYDELYDIIVYSVFC